MPSGFCVAVARHFRYIVDGKALKAYALNPDASAEQQLRNALRSPNETVQEAAAEGLGILAGLADPLSIVLDLLEAKGFDGLSEPQKCYYAVYLYNAEVNNGGHSHILRQLSRRTLEDGAGQAGE